MALQFLASYPKSGNTWVRVFMEGYFRGEEPDINALSVIKADNGPSLHDMQLRFNHGPVQAISARVVALLRLAEISAFPSIYKTHIANVSVNNIPTFPENSVRKCLYLVRDPRDVLLSYSKHLGKSIEDTLEIMLSETAWDVGDVPQIMTSWATHVRSYMNASFPVAMIKYEDMIAKPYEIFPQIIKWFNFPYDEERIKQAIKWSSFENLKKQEQEKGFKERSENVDVFFDKGYSGRWREVLETIPEFDVELMDDLGYN